MIKKILYKLIPGKLRDIMYYQHPGYRNSAGSHHSYSQEGEDMVLRRIFNDLKEGTFVDVGAHHPVYFSNTYYFYRKGWRGINIEPIPGSKDVFNEHRPEDINLEQLVSTKDTDVAFHLFDPSLMNTMSESQAEENKKFEWCKFKGTVMVKSEPLASILDRYLPLGREIDFMSVDVEGAEMEVLNSNNWEKYSPRVIVIEMIDLDVEGVLQTETTDFLKRQGYKLFAKTGNSVFFKKSGFFEFN